MPTNYMPVSFFHGQYFSLFALPAWVSEYLAEIEIVDTEEEGRNKWTETEQ